jgi:hypothetical protein
VPAATDGAVVNERLRRRNWIAIVAATPLMMFSYFTYAAAFVDDEGGRSSVQLELAFVGLAVAPFVFIVLGFVSRNPAAPKRVLAAMGLLLLVGLTLGLLDPLVGAATGFGLGGALVLNRPGISRVMFWRIGAVVFTAIYMSFLLVVAVPAGVFTGAILPLMMIGFADEYAAWSASRTAE